MKYIRKVYMIVNGEGKRLSKVYILKYAADKMAKRYQGYSPNSYFGKKYAGAKVIESICEWIDAPKE